ncbi:MAG: alpha/beta fold hydrolase [Gammaproteobacteria bacterium]|nr:alpha/beta fold hydrolase [Gammaproteobacteria bacterium]
MFLIDEYMLIYIHGFNSSPASFKASLLQNFAATNNIADRILIPGISSVPATAIEQLKQLIEQNTPIGKSCPICLVGSSLGGFYATWLAEHYDCRVVLINPAVKPYELLDAYLGSNTNYYTGEEFELTMEHMNQLRELEVKKITHPDRYLLMLQTGDEVLDYKRAIEKYAAVPSIVEEGGSHAFMGFDRHLQTVLAFCGINCLKNYA